MRHFWLFSSCLAIRCIVRTKQAPNFAPGRSRAVPVCKKQRWTRNECYEGHTKLRGSCVPRIPGRLLRALRTLRTAQPQPELAMATSGVPAAAGCFGRVRLHSVLWPALGTRHSAPCAAGQHACCPTNAALAAGCRSDSGSCSSSTSGTRSAFSSACGGRG